MHLWTADTSGCAISRALVLAMRQEMNVGGCQPRGSSNFGDEKDTSTLALTLKVQLSEILQ